MPSRCSLMTSTPACAEPTEMSSPPWQRPKPLWPTRHTRSWDSPPSSSSAPQVLPAAAQPPAAPPQDQVPGKPSCPGHAAALWLQLPDMHSISASCKLTAPMACSLHHALGQPWKLQDRTGTSCRGASAAFPARCLSPAPAHCAWAASLPQPLPSGDALLSAQSTAAHSALQALASPATC